MANTFVTSTYSSVGIGTLGWIVQRFIRATSRYDLIQDGDIDNPSDNGALYYINEGQRVLDGLLDLPERNRRFVKVVPADSYYTSIENIVEVYGVWFVNSSCRADITSGHLDPASFRGNLGVVDEWKIGTPKYWTLMPSELSEELNTVTADDLASDGASDYGELEYSPSVDSDVFMWYPKCDGEYTLDIMAKFWSTRLSNMYDKTVLTSRYSDLLVLASMWVLEGHMQNASRQRAILEQLMTRVDRVDSEIVAKEFSGVPARVNG